MDLFDDLISFGSYNPADALQLAVAEFCFLHIIQKELTSFQHDWNGHRIRRTSTSGCPGGIPNELFDLPHLHRFSNLLRTVDDQQIQVLFAEAEEPPTTSSPEVNHLCVELCAINGWELPFDRESACTLFLRIVSKL